MYELEALAAKVAELLKERGETVAVAESSAGGLISAALLAVPGASAYYLGGGVIYTRDAREALMGFTDEELRGIRSSSEPYAVRLAERVREKLDTDWAIGETGAAGPSGNRYGDAAGHTCIAIAGPMPQVITVETSSPDRVRNMWRFTAEALDLFERTLKVGVGLA